MFSAANALNEAAYGAMPPVEFVKALTPTLVAGRPHVLNYLAGAPGAMVAPTPGVAGAALTAYPGSLRFQNPLPGLETRLMRLQAQATQGGSLLLCDRLWHNSGLSATSTLAQPVNSVAWPARDSSGAIDGEQVLVGLEVSTATGAGTPALTLGYTDSDGVAGMIGVNSVATVASSPAGSFYPMGLAAGDRGVRGIQTFQLSTSWTSGVFHLVAYRVLARLELAAGIPNAIDALTSGFVKHHDNTVPFLMWIPSATTATGINGHVIFTQA